MDNSKQTTRPGGAKPLTKARLKLLDRLALCSPGQGEIVYRADKVAAKKMAKDGLCELREAWIVSVAIITPRGRAELARHEATPDVPPDHGFYMNVDDEQVHVLGDPNMSDEQAQSVANVVRAAKKALDNGWRPVAAPPAATPGNGTGVTCPHCDSTDTYLAFKVMNGVMRGCKACGQLSLHDTPEPNAASASAEPQLTRIWVVTGDLFGDGQQVKRFVQAVDMDGTLGEIERLFPGYGTVDWEPVKPAEPPPSDVRAADNDVPLSDLEHDVLLNRYTDWLMWGRDAEFNIAETHLERLGLLVDPTGDGFYSITEAGRKRAAPLHHHGVAHYTYPATESALTAAEAATVAAIRRHVDGNTVEQPYNYVALATSSGIGLGKHYEGDEEPQVLSDMIHAYLLDNYSTRLRKLLAIITRLTTPQPDALPDGVSVEREDTTDSRGKPFTAIEVRCNDTLWIEVRRYVRPRDGSTQIAVVPHERPLSIAEAALYHAALGVALSEAAKLEREAK